MNKDEAKQLRDKLVDLCREHCQWAVISEEHKPNLKKITVEVSIKIDN